jgi:anaerobic selenocysteine-containing dehydrogenase
VAPQSAYSLRLVVNRTLYDDGTGISHCDSSAALAPAAALRVAPLDAAPLGIETGTRVTVISPNGSLSVAATVDPAVPKGTAVLRHNLDGADAGLLIATGDVVCDIRVEVA